MKKTMSWILRICCLIVIGVAAFTLIRCLLEANKDYSEEAVRARKSSPAVTASITEIVAQTPVPSMPDYDAVDENPTVVLRTESAATVNNPTVRTTASFGNIVNGIRADLSWYVDGELAKEESDCLLVEGSTISYDTTVEVNDESPEEVDVSLTVKFQKKEVSAETTFQVERPGTNGSVLIQTMEITVTADERSDIFKGSDLMEGTGGTMEAKQTGLLLAYERDDEGLSALKLKFEDGSEGWVNAGHMQITKEDCTTDEDYTEEQKVDFVNSMNYDSRTSNLVWVSLYTQKVNIFKGYQGHWSLEKSFDCASGTNESPTTTGIFSITEQKDRWDLGENYVEPVLVFNGGEAFTSRPFSAETDKIVDETIGKPASGGGVRLMEEDIQWMADNLPMETLVVVY